MNKMKLKSITFILPLMLMLGVHAENTDSSEKLAASVLEKQTDNVVQEEKELTEEEQVQQWYEKGVKAHKVHDLIRSIKWLTKAAEKDHTEAQAHLGYFYVYAGEQDKGLPLMRLAAEKNNTLALRELAVAYGKGIGVEQSDSKAMEYLEKAQSLGDELSIYAIAGAYENGKFGLSKDETLAKEMFQQLSDDGFGGATHRLIKAIEEGQLGFTKDPVKAAEMKQALRAKVASETKSN
ncbi:hypothetical protein A9Q98_08465 [Thalassotalea sp. 42_200_T64]|nr:hypothetical protein A9Q98_08465 [Thalassotalea sp. 42_200_T64]